MTPVIQSATGSKQTNQTTMFAREELNMLDKRNRSYTQANGGRVTDMLDFLADKGRIDDGAGKDTKSTELK